MSFQQIKKSISKAPVLASPYFSKDFYVFSFASKFTIAGVLLHKNSEGCEQPISFFNRALRDAELKYNIMKKQSYAMIQSLKYFQVYVLHSHIISYVSNAVVKEILT